MTKGERFEGYTTIETGQFMIQPKEKKYLYVYRQPDGEYKLGDKPHPLQQYYPIIGKIEVQND
jgi:hypothetical protein